MLRRHPAPPPSNFDPLVKAARQQGFNIAVDSGKPLLLLHLLPFTTSSSSTTSTPPPPPPPPPPGKLLADSLNAAEDPARPYMNTMLRMITTRCATTRGRETATCSTHVCSHFFFAATFMLGL